jgi:hypothetical protein
VSRVSLRGGLPGRSRRRGPGRRHLPQPYRRVVAAGGQGLIHDLYLVMPGSGSGAGGVPAADTLPVMGSERARSVVAVRPKPMPARGRRSSGAGRPALAEAARLFFPVLGAGGRWATGAENARSSDSLGGRQVIPHRRGKKLPGVGAGGLMVTAMPGGRSAWQTTSISACRPRSSEGLVLDATGRLGGKPAPEPGGHRQGPTPPSFLPQAAEDLDAVLTDPDRGGALACRARSSAHGG